MWANLLQYEALDQEMKNALSHPRFLDRIQFNLIDKQRINQL